MLLKKQNPAATAAWAWWPGGRTRAKALSVSPETTLSMAFITPPAASLAASYVSAVATVSGSSIMVFPAVAATASM